jgi:hypothetical protein
LRQIWAHFHISHRLWSTPAPALAGTAGRLTLLVVGRLILGAALGFIGHLVNRFELGVTTRRRKTTTTTTATTTTTTTTNKVDITAAQALRARS